jgi:hypothetical protein
VMSLFDDNIEWVQPGESSVSGTFHSKAEIMEHLGRLAEKGLTVKLNRLVAEDDTVHGGDGWWRNRHGCRCIYRARRQDRSRRGAR